MIAVRRLRHVAITATDADAWREFGRDLIGAAVESRGVDTVLHFDAEGAQLIVHAGHQDALEAVGWDVADEAELEAVHNRVAACGAQTRELSAAECVDRRAVCGFAVADPAGIVNEVVVGRAERAEAGPMLNTFVTGDRGLGHVIVAAADVDASMDFYLNALGLRMTDTVAFDVEGFPVRLTFLHANARHHSVAFVNVPLPTALHHLMVEVADLDDVGRAYDRFLDAGRPISLTLGRHLNDGVFSFYAPTPSGFDIEIGSGGVLVDDADWEVATHARPSAWGHRRST